MTAVVAPRRKRGGQPVADHLRRSKLITIKVTESEREALNRIAAERGITVAELVRAGLPGLGADQAAADPEPQQAPRQISVYLEPESWKRFRALALEHDTSASAILTALMNRFMGITTKEQQRIVTEAKAIGSRRAANRTRWQRGEPS